MPFTAEQQAAFMKQCYGCNINDYVESIEESFTYRFEGKDAIIVSLLSDAQEMLEWNSPKDEIRQHLNRVKYLIHNLPNKNKEDC